MARADNSRLSILKSAPSSVRHGRASLGTVRRGGDRQGTARKGAARNWQQSIGYWQQYHFECCGNPMQARVRFGRAGLGEERRGKG